MTNLDSHRVYDSANLKTALFELHHGSVVNASALGKDEDRQSPRRRNVLFHTVRHGATIKDLTSVEPDGRHRAREDVLHESKKTTLPLTNLRVQKKPIMPVGSTGTLQKALL